MPSISSCLITIAANFRNENGSEFHWTRLMPEERESTKRWKVLLAEGCILAIIPLAIFETAVSRMALFATECLSNDPERRRCVKSWAASSLFSLLWAGVSAIANLSANDMITTERVARRYFSEGYYTHYPIELIP